MTPGLSFTSKQIHQINDKIMDLGNLAFAGLVIAQIFPGVSFDPIIAILGIVFTGVCYASAFMLMRKVQND